MANVSTTSSNLKIEAYFVDGDTRTITLKNPRGDISSSDIEALQAFMRTNNVIIGDKVGGTFGKISEVRKIVDEKTYLDFS